MSTFIFRDSRSIFFISSFDEILLSKQNSPRCDVTFSLSHLGLLCLPVPHIKDVRLIWVKVYWYLDGQSIVQRSMNIHDRLAQMFFISL